MSDTRKDPVLPPDQGLIRSAVRSVGHRVRAVLPLRRVR